MTLRQLLPKRLDRQVILLVTLLLCLVIPIFAFHAAKESTKRVVDAATLQSKALAENIAVTSVQHIITRDFASSEQLLLRSARFPSVMEIQITDLEGRIITDVTTQPDSEPQLRYELRQLKPPADLRSQRSEAAGLLTVWEPVIGANLVGWVQLTYSLAEAETIAQEYIYDHMLDDVVVALLLMALIQLVMRRPLRILREAATFATELQNKSGKQMRVDRGSIEIEQLSQALNSASTSLFKQEAAIKRALKALNTQKLALDEHSIVSITDVDGKITYANQKFLDATGFSREELLGKKHNIVKSEYHSDEFFSEMWQMIAAGRVWHGEILNRSKDGCELWVNTTIVPFMDEQGKIYEYVGIRTDITARKQIERELENKAGSLKRMSGHLEELVKQRTAELEQANRQLQHLNKIKSEFVAVVSHELRTPLTSIKSFAEILKDDIEELDIETKQRFLTIINDESDRLGRLINELLDLQKMESGRMIWKDVCIDLVGLLRDSMEFFSPAYHDKGLQLQLKLQQPECRLNLDADRIKQLMTNLLSNALKFTEHGGVTVTMTTTLAEVNVAITDTGLGIPEQDIEKVFESFHQVDSSETRRIGGSGLGLTICKEIVEHYQGRIWVESMLGVGSSFNFVLPLATGGQHER